MKDMKKIILNISAVLAGCFSAVSCFNLDEQVFDRMDANIYYSSEASVQGAVASIYSICIEKYPEFCYFLQEFSADQIAWRTWNGGAWGWDEGEKFVLSAHGWTSESKIIKTAWEGAWSAIGLCNNVVYDLSRINPESIGMTQEEVDSYIAEVRTLRAWAYYNIYELWGGALPLNVTSTAESSEIPGSADPDFDTSCKKIFDFIVTELDESLADLKMNEVNRMNQATNRVIKARLLLNAEVFIKENRYSECATLCKEIIAGNYGTYSIAEDYRDIYSANNTECPEVIMAFAYQEANKHNANMRNMPFLSYVYKETFGMPSCSQSGWNCCCIAPSYDNSGNVQPNGGTDGGVCFLDTKYGDKLGAVYARFNDKDIRKKPFKANADGTYEGMFLIGEQVDYNTGETLKADADRDGLPLVYVDQVGTFMNLGRELTEVMNPRWGETNSGLRLMKYPIFPDAAGINFVDIDEVEFRLSEVVYMLAECELRAGNTETAKDLVKSVKGRYFANTDDALELPMGFSAYDEDWMLHEWGIEFLGEGRRRRTDLRRFDQFTQGQWWFFGRDTEAGYDLTETRDRKYEWYPLPESALSVNPGLVQNPNY